MFKIVDVEFAYIIDAILDRMGKMKMRTEDNLIGFQIQIQIQIIFVLGTSMWSHVQSKRYTA